MHAGDAALAAVLKRDRAIVFAALAAVTALAWAYVLWLAAAMDMSMPATMAPGFAPWAATHLLFVFAMWAVMMTGMMTPSAAPMILLYTQVARQAATLGKPFAPAAWFAGGYLAVWTLFALAATLAQFGLERAALISPMMAVTSRPLGGVILIGAGLYQWTPLKNACLAACRAPLVFVQRRGGFKADALGSFELGIRHGAYCLGCCWLLMTILFAGGVMNLLWIAGLAILVLAEKVLPRGPLLARLAGACAAVAGAWLIAT